MSQQISKFAQPGDVVSRYGIGTQGSSRIAPRATERLELFLRQRHEEPLAPAPAPTVALNAANEPMAVVVDLDKRSLAAPLDKREG